MAYPLGLYRNGVLKGIPLAISKDYIGLATPRGIYGIDRVDIISRVSFRRNLDTYILFQKLQQSHKDFYNKYYSVSYGECSICMEPHQFLHFAHTTRPLREEGDPVYHRLCSSCMKNMKECPMCRKRIELDYSSRSNISDTATG